MSSLEHLSHLMYHEKQESGSMLCAQHALNSLLQGNFFTAPDLSAIARQLDQLERSYDDDNRGASMNMDDTGFFSVQVLENALDVWGLNLLRWRSEAMRPYNDRPHAQLGFILNLNQHWFTLRRFGSASPNPDADQGRGHWFNLDSFLNVPERVSKLYLSMVLQQAEQEGYSVFVVTQSNLSEPLALPRTEADELAEKLADPSSASTSQVGTSGSTSHGDISMEGYEDEDMDLQQALQASLGMAGGSPSNSFMQPNIEPLFHLSIPPPTARSARSPIDSGTQTPIQLPRSRLQAESPGSSSEATSPVQEDPVAASMARNRSIMQRMRLHQEMALRGNYEDPNLVERRRREEEDEEDMIRRAIAESETIHRQQPHPLEAEADHTSMEEDSNHGSLPPSYVPKRSASEHRVYDDEDEELQAALKASLDDVPEDYEIPESPPARPSVFHPHQASLTQEEVLPTEINVADESKKMDAETESETSSVTSAEEQQMSMDDLRRKRLARFGQ